MPKAFWAIIIIRRQRLKNLDVEFLRVREYSRVLPAMVRGRISNRPFLLSHLITQRCECGCDFCLWKGSSEELSTHELFQIYRDAKDAGFIATTFWGGEPLIREDFPDILRHAHELGLMTVLITNGYSLPSKAAVVTPFLNTVIVSIDYPSTFHDSMRKKEGVFERAVEGIKEVRARNKDCKVFINCVISKFNRNKVEEMVFFADKLGVSISFESLNTKEIGFAGDAASLKLTAAEESEIFAVLRSYKQRGYRVNNSYTYLDTFIGGKKRYKCHARKMILTILPNGDVRNCLDGRPYANVRQRALKQILRMPELRRHQKEAEACFCCNDTGVIESSYFWKLKPEVLLNTLKLFTAV